MPYTNESSRAIRSNAVIIGQICEKIICNEFAELGVICKNNLDPYGWYDLEKVTPTGEKKYVQVKGSTPYFKYNTWKIHKEKTWESIKNILRCDEMFIISLAVNTYSFNPHPTDMTIVRVFVDKLSESNNIKEDAFVLHREYHKHMYEIVRPLTELEVSLIRKYPTSKYQ